METILGSKNEMSGGWNVPERPPFSLRMALLEGESRMGAPTTALSAPADLAEAFRKVVRVLADASRTAILLKRWVLRSFMVGYLTVVPLKAMAASSKKGAATPVVEARANTVEATTLAAGEGGEMDGDAASMPLVTVIGRSEKDYQVKSASSPKYGGPLIDVPQTLSIVPQALLSDQGSSNLAQALQNVPGITLNAGEGGTPAGDSFNIRGFSAKDDMYIDGTRDTGNYTRDTFDVDHVEVSQGPSSSYSGRGSTGGTINVVSKDPDASKPFASVSLSAGTANGGVLTGVKRGTADVNQPLNVAGLEEAGLRLNVMQQDSGVAGRQYIENKAWGLAPSLSFKLGQDTKLTFDYYSLRQDNTPDYGVPSFGGTNRFAPPGPEDPSLYYGLLGLDHERVTVNSGWVRWEQKLSPALDLRDQLSYVDAYVDRIVTDVEVYTPINGVRSTKTHLTDDQTLDEQLDLTAKFDTAGLGHTAVGGVEYAHQYSSFGHYAGGGPNWKFVDPVVPITGSPDPNDAYAGPVTLSPNTVRMEADDLAAYALDTIKLDKQWQVTGGVRYDYYEPNNILDGAVTTAGGWQYNPVVPIASQGMWSWHAGVIYKPEENGTLYASVGDSYLPSTQGLAAVGGAYSTINRVANAQAQESLSYEMGTKWNLFSGKLTATAAVFRTDMLNALETNPDDPSGPQVNGGNQRVDGASVGFQGSPVEYLNLYAGYTYLNGQVLSGTGTASGSVTNQAGWKLGGVAEDSVNLWGTYELPFHLQVGLGAAYSSGWPIRTDAVPVMLPSYLVFNGMLSYPLTKEMDVQLNLYNLGDTLYWTQGGFWVEGTRRSGVLTTSYRF
ncbi:MAG TPA: TonB-dependent receptor [bacterium]|nr:TonB-dependent receptor [bacterium]